VDFIQTTWEFCDDQRIKGCRALGGNLQKNENSLARAFGGDGGTCECRGGCPPGTPSVVTSRAGPFPLSLFSSRKDFWRMSGIIFLARALGITRNHIKPLQTNGGLSSTCMHVRA
jgi:hypothetical protein